MRLLNFFPSNPRIDFVKLRVPSFILAALVVIVSLGGWAIRGLNMGVDFKGGILIELRMPDVADVGAVREQLQALSLGDVKLQEFGSPRDLMVRVERQAGGEEAQLAAVNKIKTALGEDVEYRRIDTVGPKVSEDLKNNALVAVLLSTGAMLLYIWVRFEWHFSVCSIIAQLHDCIAVMGMYALAQVEFNETALIAILTTLGYSINDTVVIYDRMRENLRKYKAMPIPELINLSVNSTLSRTLLTSFTTILALIPLYCFGGNVISTFVLPIIVGIALGTFSSIFVAPVLLLSFDMRRAANVLNPTTPEAENV